MGTCPVTAPGERHVHRCTYPPVPDHELHLCGCGDLFPTPLEQQEAS